MQLTVAVAMPVKPGVPLSVTCSRMVLVPAGAVQVKTAFCTFESSNAPSLSRSHANVSVEPSGSDDPEEENDTVSGARPEVGFAVIAAFGALY